MSEHLKQSIPIQPYAIQDNESFNLAQGRYQKVTVSTKLVLADWRRSLFAHEWLEKDGSIRVLEDLKPAIKRSRLDVEEKIGAQQPLMRPLLGFGMLDTIEIATERATFLTLAALGVEYIEVYILKSDEKAFRAYCV